MTQTILVSKKNSEWWVVYSIERSQADGQIVAPRISSSAHKIAVCARDDEQQHLVTTERKGLLEICQQHVHLAYFQGTGQSTGLSRDQERLSRKLRHEPSPERRLAQGKVKRESGIIHASGFKHAWNLPCVTDPMSLDIRRSKGLGLGINVPGSGSALVGVDISQKDQKEAEERSVDLRPPRGYSCIGAVAHRPRSTRLLAGSPPGGPPLLGLPYSLDAVGGSRREC